MAAPNELDSYSYVLAATPVEQTTVVYMPVMYYIPPMPPDALTTTTTPHSIEYYPSTKIPKAPPSYPTDQLYSILQDPSGKQQIVVTQAQESMNWVPHQVNADYHPEQVNYIYDTINQNENALTYDQTQTPEIPLGYAQTTKTSSGTYAQTTEGGLVIYHQIEQESRVTYVPAQPQVDEQANARQNDKEQTQAQQESEDDTDEGQFWDADGSENKSAMHFESIEEEEEEEEEEEVRSGETYYETAEEEEERRTHFDRRQEEFEGSNDARLETSQEREFEDMKNSALVEQDEMEATAHFDNDEDNDDDDYNNDSQNEEEEDQQLDEEDQQLGECDPNTEDKGLDGGALHQEIQNEQEVELFSQSEENLTAQPAQTKTKEATSDSAAQFDENEATSENPWRTKSVRKRKHYLVRLEQKKAQQEARRQAPNSEEKTKQNAVKTTTTCTTEKQNGPRTNFSNPQSNRRSAPTLVREDVSDDKPDPSCRKYQQNRGPCAPRFQSLKSNPTTQLVHFIQQRGVCTSAASCRHYLPARERHTLIYNPVRGMDNYFDFRTYRRCQDESYRRQRKGHIGKDNNGENNEAVERGPRWWICSAYHILGYRMTLDLLQGIPKTLEYIRHLTMTASGATCILAYDNENRRDKSAYLRNGGEEYNSVTATLEKQIGHLITNEISTTNSVLAPLRRLLAHIQQERKHLAQWNEWMDTHDFEDIQKYEKEIHDLRVENMKREQKDQTENGALRLECARLKQENFEKDKLCQKLTEENTILKRNEVDWRHEVGRLTDVLRSRSMVHDSSRSDLLAETEAGHCRIRILRDRLQLAEGLLSDLKRRNSQLYHSLSLRNSNSKPSNYSPNCRPPPTSTPTIKNGSDWPSLLEAVKQQKHGKQFCQKNNKKYGGVMYHTILRRNSPSNHDDSCPNNESLTKQVQNFAKIIEGEEETEIGDNTILPSQNPLDHEKTYESSSSSLSRGTPSPTSSLSVNGSDSGISGVDHHNGCHDNQRTGGEE